MILGAIMCFTNDYRKGVEDANTHAYEVMVGYIYVPEQ